MAHTQDSFISTSQLNDRVVTCVTNAVCICVCSVHVCVCVYMCACVCICMCVHCMCVQVCMCVYLCMCVYVCMHVCTCVHVCIWVYLCMCVYVCMHVCMCVCVCETMQRLQWTWLWFDQEVSQERELFLCVYDMMVALCCVQIGIIKPCPCVHMCACVCMCVHVCKAVVMGGVWGGLSPRKIFG